MRKTNAKAYHKIQTAEKVLCPHLDYKTGKKTMRNKVVKFNCSPLVSKGDLENALRQAESSIQSHFSEPVEIDFTKGTVGGVKVKAVFTGWELQFMTTTELGCSPLHRMVTIAKNKSGKKFAITHTFNERDAMLTGDQLKAKVDGHFLFAPEEEHPIPSGWITQVGEVGHIERKEEIPKHLALKAAQAVFFPQKNEIDIREVFLLSNEEVFDIAFPIYKPVKKENKKWYSCFDVPLKNSHKILYRLLHYFGEIKVAKGDFYKGNLASVRLGHTGAIASFYFWKNEIAVQLICPENLCTLPEEKSQGMFTVVCGVPGSMNKSAPKPSKEASDAFKQLLKIIQTKTAIYSGSNFVV